MFFKTFKKNPNLKEKFIAFTLLLFVFMILGRLNRIKVCLCTIGKQENLYIREYVSHYKNYGIDKIFIYDNNDINEEKFESVLGDYIENGFIKIFNFRGKINNQLYAYQDCLNRNYDKYNWVIFYDMDEFIHLKQFKDIKKYLKQKKFIKCQSIQLNGILHSDNNLLYYDNRTLFQRFKSTIKKPKEALKSIIKGNNKIRVNCPHNINKNLKSCNGFGDFNQKEKDGIFTKYPDYQYYYIDHFCFKSTQEFINKINKGDVLFGTGDDLKMIKIDWYFSKNKITLKKIEFIENQTKLNLFKYRNKVSYKE